MTMGEREKKSSKRKELSQSQLRAIASTMARALTASSEEEESWQDFAQLPQSERRKVVDFLSEAVHDVPCAKLIRLSRMTLTGGVVNKHEGALKSVVGLCSRALPTNGG